MKTKSIDIYKTISDFISVGEENPEEKAREYYKIKHSLTDHGLEKYMQYYFEKFRNYIIENPKTYKRDGGIDLKGIRKNDKGEKEFLIVQCKNYSIKDISEDAIASFYGKIARKVLLEVKENTNLYYITTSKFTKSAKKFGLENNIKTIDFIYLYNLQEIYSIYNFKNDLNLKEGHEEVQKCFEKIQLTIDFNNSNNLQIPTDKEVCDLLKQVRKDVSEKINNRIGYIAKNTTLQLLSKERPHNLDSLKYAIRSLPKREKNKLEKYGFEFVERLKYIKSN